MKASLLAHALLALAVFSAPRSAFAYNADPWPGDTRDIGPHATVSRIAAEYMRAAREAPVRAAGQWLGGFAGNLDPKAMFADRQEAGTNAFLRGANGPDRLNTIVDVDETRLCFAGMSPTYEVKIPKGRIGPVSWSQKRLFTVPAKKIAEMLRARVKDPFAKAVLGAATQGGCAVHLCKSAACVKGTELPLHTSGLNHFVREGKDVGLHISTDSSLFKELPQVAEAMVREKVEKFIAARLPSFMRKRLSKAISTFVARAVRPVWHGVIRWFRDAFLTKLVVVERIRPQFAAGKAVDRQTSYLRKPLLEMNFESARAMSDWWYGRAVHWWHAGDRVRAVLALGHAAHFLQDNALPHHNYGFLFGGHGEWEDRTHPYLAKLFRARWHAGASCTLAGCTKGKLFSTAVNEALSFLKRGDGLRRSPGATILGPLWRVVKTRYPDLAAKGAREPLELAPARTSGAARYPGDVAGVRWTYAQHDLVQSVAVTAWVVTKFHREAVVASRPSPPQGTAPRKAGER